jgi:hypothetical protein
MYPLTYPSSKTKKYLNIKRRNGEIHKIVVVNRGGKAAILEKLHARHHISADRRDALC